MTAAEQLAAAIARVIEETAEKIAARGQASPDASLTTVQVAQLLGYHRSFVLRLAKARPPVLKSDGEGRGRRYRPADVEDFRRRLRAANGRIWDVEKMTGRTEGRAATAAH